MPTLKDTRVIELRTRMREGIPHLSMTQALVVAQVAISLLLLVAAGLFVRTLTNLQSIQLGSWAFAFELRRLWPFRWTMNWPSDLDCPAGASCLPADQE